MSIFALNPTLREAVSSKRSASMPWYRNGSPLANSLMALWPLDEVSGTRFDVIGSNHLTDNNTVTSAAGITYPLAAEFVIANSESLHVLDNAALSAADINMWGGAWIYPSTVGITGTPFSKWDTTGNREWLILQSNDDLVLQVSPNGTATGVGQVTFTDILVANQWNLAIWEHDSVNNLIGLSVNSSPFLTVAYSGGMSDKISPLRIGAQGGVATSFFGGRVQQAMLGKNYVPTMQDIVNIYNAGVTGGMSSIQFFGYGGEAEWSHDGETIAFDRRDLAGTYQLFTISPDGTGEVCISDTVVAGAPAIDRHKGWPDFHPTDDYLVFQCEIADQENTGGGTPEQVAARHSTAEPGAGYWNDVWVCRTDGSEWWKLTNYSAAGDTGVLSPRFSPDGTKLFWARRIAAPSAGHTFGGWDLQLANFSIVGGVPTLGSITTLTPGSKTFYEAHGFNRFGTKIYFTSDPDTGNEFGLDIFSCDLDGGNLINLTASDAQWDEHLDASPVENYLAFGSSKPYPAYLATAVAGLKMEAHLMRDDGTEERQLTHFNTPGVPEYDSDPSVSTVMAWNPSGTQLIVVQLSTPGSAKFDTIAGRRMWKITLRGPSSGTVPASNLLLDETGDILTDENGEGLEDT